MNIAQKLMDHRFAGLCPDAVDGWDRRDPDCPACRALDALAEQGTEEWERTLGLDVHGVVYERTKATSTRPAGPWVPVEEPNRPDGSGEDG